MKTPDYPDDRSVQSDFAALCNGIVKKLNDGMGHHQAVWSALQEDQACVRIKLISVAERLVIDPSPLKVDHEDLAHGAWIALCRQFQNKSYSESPGVRNWRAYVTSIFRTHILGQLRRIREGNEGRLVTVSYPVDCEFCSTLRDPLTEAIALERRVMIRIIVDGMPPEVQAYVHSRISDEMSYREMGRELQIDHTTARARVLDAFGQIAVHLRELGYDEYDD